MHCLEIAKRFKGGGRETGSGWRCSEETKTKKIHIKKGMVKRIGRQPRREVYSLLHPLSLGGGELEAEVKARCERAARHFAVSSAPRYHSLVCVSSRRGSGLEEDPKILLQNNIPDPGGAASHRRFESSKQRLALCLQPPVEIGAFGRWSSRTLPSTEERHEAPFVTSQ